jgi:hypothetical protein
MVFKEKLRSFYDSLLLFFIYSVLKIFDTVSRPRLYFDKGERPVVDGYNVDLARRGTDVTRYYLKARRLKEGRRPVLAPVSGGFC